MPGKKPNGNFGCGIINDGGENSWPLLQKRPYQGLGAGSPLEGIDFKWFLAVSLRFDLHIW